MKENTQKLLKKGIFITISIISFLLLVSFFNPSTVRGATTSIIKDYVSNQDEIPGNYSLPCDTPSLCSTIEIDCWNSEAPGVTNCGNFCTGGNPWTKYTFLQDAAIDCRQFDENRCVAVFHSDGLRTCSTGDKFNENNKPVLNAGFCSCAVGGAYKTCCSVSTGKPVNARGFAVDPYAPLEGDCNGAFLCGQTSGDTKVVCCGGAGQPPCGDAACALPATPTPTPAPIIGCQTDAASAVGCEVGCKIVNGIKYKCHIYNRNLQNVCDTQCPAPVGVAEWNCVIDNNVCPQPATPTPTPNPCGPGWTIGAIKTTCVKNACTLK